MLLTFSLVFRDRMSTNESDAAAKSNYQDPNEGGKFTKFPKTFQKKIRKIFFSIITETSDVETMLCWDVS